MYEYEKGKDKIMFKSRSKTLIRVILKHIVILDLLLQSSNRTWKLHLIQMVLSPTRWSYIWGKLWIWARIKWAFNNNFPPSPKNHFYSIDEILFDNCAKFKTLSLCHFLYLNFYLLTWCLYCYISILIFFWKTFNIWCSIAEEFWE